MTTDTTVLDGLDFPDPGLAVGDDVADLLFREARTAAAFTPDEVTDEQLAAVYDLVKWGPTAMNTIPLRLLVVRTPEARERLAAHMSEGNRERVAAAPVSLVLAATPASTSTSRPWSPHMPGARDALAGQPEQREPMARTNALIQAGYLIVGLRAAGLAAGPMARHGLRRHRRGVLRRERLEVAPRRQRRPRRGRGHPPPPRPAPRATPRSPLTV